MTDTAVNQGSQDELTAMLAEAGLLPNAPVTLSNESDEDLPAERLVETIIEGVETLIEGIEAAPLAIEEAPGELIDDVAALLDAEEAKAEAYASQESAVEMHEAQEAPAATPRAARAPRAASATPRTPRFSGTPGQFVASQLGSEFEAIVDGMPIKVREKATNLADHVASGKALSVYTQVAVDMLKTDGAVSAKKLVERLVVASKKNGGAGYSIGTARSQAQQQMTLLAGFGVAKKSGTDLVLDTASSIWARLTAPKVSAAPAPVEAAA